LNAERDPLAPPEYAIRSILDAIDVMSTDHLCRNLRD